MELVEVAVAVATSVFIMHGIHRVALAVLAL
jgi:hypothetical protein